MCLRVPLSSSLVLVGTTVIVVVVVCVTCGHCAAGGAILSLLIRQRHYSALMHAASQGGKQQMDQVNLLLDAGIDVNLKDDVRGHTSLCARCAWQHAPTPCRMFVPGHVHGVSGCHGSDMKNRGVRDANVRGTAKTPPM